MRISDWSSDVCSSDLRGVEIRWACDKSLLDKGDATPEKDSIHFPNGLSDFLASTLEKRKTLTPEPFVGEAKFPDDHGRVEWAISWPLRSEEHTSELQSLMRISYAVFCLKNKNSTKHRPNRH